MAQHDYNLANQSGADFRADLNNALSAIATTNSGATSPSTTFAHQLWVDTANSVLKIRNSANDAWITTGVSITADNTFDINGGTVNGITSFSFSTGSTVTSILDEDDLVSDSATALATQQSIKAYVDSQVATVDTLAEILLNGNSTGGTDISLSSSDITGTGNINITGTIQSSGTITGNLTGDVTGNASTATALETARTINGTSFDGTANISFDTDSVSEGSSNLYYTTARFDSAFSGKSTSDLSEGTNLYYTDTRFDTRLATKDTDDLTEGTNLYFTNARVESYLDAGTSTPTFASAVINSSITGSAVLDDDTFATASATTVATSESIKAYVDSQVGSVDTLAEILSNGNTTGGTDIAFGDNDKATFGASADLQIYHDGTNSYINDTGTGNLIVKAGDDLRLQSGTGENYLIATTDSGVQIFHDNSKKFETTTSGINVTGDINLNDNYKAVFGDSSDLQIYHTGTQNYIEDVGTGNLNFKSNGNNFNFLDGSDNLVLQIDLNSATKLYHNTSEKLATSSTGIDVTGTVTADGVGLAAGSTISSAGGLIVTIDDDNSSGSTYFEINADGTSKSIARFVENGDISFYDDTGTTQGLFWDASTERLGIGTTSPQRKLHVIDDAIIDGASGANLYFRPNTSYSGSGNFGIFTTGLTSGTYESTMTIKGYGSGVNDVMTIKGLGNVGIGTASPAEKLSIQDGDIIVQNDTKVTFGYRGTSASSALAFRDRFAGVDRVTIDTSGNVGIGTDNPASKLHIQGSGTTVAQITGGASNVAGIYLGDTGGIANGRLSYSNADNSLQLFTNGSEKARITSGGNVGIGTTAPRTKLHISGLTGDDDPSLGSSTAPLFVSNTANSYGLNVGVNVVGDAWLQAQSNTAATAYNLLLNPLGGNVGIGNTSPAKNLHITDSTSPTIRFSRDNSFYWDIGHTSSDFQFISETGGTILHMNYDGNVGIGTTSPNAPLHITNTAPAILLTDSDTSADSRISASSGAGSLFIDADLNNEAAFSTMYFRIDGSEVGRFDTSGHLLVGTTSTSPSLSNVAGIALRNEGHIYASRDGGVVSYFNRKTSDGTILDFRKDGANVGNIGTTNDDLLIYSTATGHKGLRFAGGEILPVSNAGALEDNTTDLGSTAYRFKNLQLSGTANVGDIEIGTSADYTPVSGLAINEAVNTPAIEIIPTTDENSSNTASIRLWGTRFGTANRYSEIKNITDGSTANNELAFNTNGSERLRIDSSGNVGIGTVTPNYLLDVEGSGSLLRVNSTSGNSIVQLSVPDTTSITGVNFGDSGSTTAGYIWYRHTGDSMAFTTAGSEAMRILSSGNVGIGITSPSATLHVNKDGTGQNIALFSSDLGVNNRNFGILSPATDSASAPFEFTTGNSFQFTIDGVAALNIASDKSVGIGTASPARELELSAANPRFRITDTDGGYAEISGNTGHLALQADVGNTQAASRIDFEIDGSSKARLTNAGKFGVGTTSISGVLHAFSGSSGVTPTTDANELVLEASANVGMSLLCANTGVARIRFGDSDSNQRGTVFYNHNNDSLGFQTAGSTAMTIDSSNRVMIGQTTSNAASGTIVPQGYRGREGTGGTERNNFNIAWTGSAANLWIDTTNVGTITTSSDYRIKDNIETQTADAISRVMKIRPVTYKLTNYDEIFKVEESNEIKEGFIAHELAEIIPSAVVGEKDDPKQIQSLKLDALVSVLTKAIQEQQEQIESLKSEIAKLKGE